MRGPWPVKGLYAITPEETNTRRLLQLAESVLAQGIALMQYRNKGTDPVLRLEQALGLKLTCLTYGVPLIINDDIELARSMQADGVHLGQTDGDPAAAREELGPDALIGMSCYASLDRARAARSQGADYLAFGAFFDSPSKPAAARANPSILRDARRFELPLVAIGGIQPDNVHTLRSAGADLIAVISGLWSAPDPSEAASAYIAAFEEASDPSS